MSISQENLYIIPYIMCIYEYISCVYMSIGFSLRKAFISSRAHCWVFVAEGSRGYPRPRGQEDKVKWAAVVSCLSLQVREHIL